MRGKVCILGSFNVDIVARVERFPVAGESLRATGSSFGAGGKGANQALAAASAGAEVHFVSKTGNDQFGSFARQHLQESAIDSLSLLQSEQQPTGNAVIYVSEASGENMVAVFPGANNTLTEADVDSILPRLKSSAILLLQLENNFDAILHALRLAKREGIPVVLNPAPVSLQVREWLPLTDIVTPNETEASLLSGIPVTGISSAEQAAREIVSLGAKQVIITLGAGGVLLYDGSDMRHIPAFPAKPVDTTGAGDAFNGALVAALARGESLLQAAIFASAFASLAVERAGASSMPSYQQTCERLAESE